eukprot:76275-Prymnesium_polylepis.1
MRQHRVDLLEAADRAERIGEVGPLRGPGHRLGHANFSRRQHGADLRTLGERRGLDRPGDRDREVGVALRMRG